MPGERELTGAGTHCAIRSRVIAMTGLPGLLPEAVARYTLWASTVFLQLVLLSVILVGQSEEAVASEQRADATYHDAEAVLPRPCRFRSTSSPRTWCSSVSSIASRPKDVAWPKSPPRVVQNLSSQRRSRPRHRNRRRVARRLCVAGWRNACLGVGLAQRCLDRVAGRSGPGRSGRGPHRRRKPATASRRP